MACNEGTTPINVTSTQQKCNLTCLYEYDYGNSSLNVTNQGDHLSFSYDGDNTTVKYNKQEYTVQECRLYAPSLNQYNGTNKSAELIIHHINSSGNNLLVCIPIDENNAASASSALFNQIIPFVPSSAGSTQTINVTNYSLNHFIPKSGYYSYEGTLPYQPCNGTYNIILFDPAHAINMNRENMITISSILLSVSSTIQSINQANYYYNEKGTTQNELIGDDIYIDCRPIEEIDGDGNAVGGSTDAASSMERRMASSINHRSMQGLSPKTIKYLISISGIIGGIGIIYLLMYLWKKVNKRIADADV